MTSTTSKHSVKPAYQDNMSSLLGALQIAKYPKLLHVDSEDWSDAEAQADLRFECMDKSFSKFWCACTKLSKFSNAWLADGSNQSFQSNFKGKGNPNLKHVLTEEL